MKNKQVLLTGGTGGLGLGVTPAILAHGAIVTIPYLEEKTINQLKSNLSATDFEQIRFVKADLTQETAVERLVKDMGKVDVLIHLVGGFSMGTTHNFSFADWQKTIEVTTPDTDATHTVRASYYR
jgi:NAD(P)-dependent dehydrogenase (short-subunit alcohol dehydrogenase family)